jgi:hypothetical protein
MTIRDKTARARMYAWHSGMGSAFYAAASSGLVASFVALSNECMTIDDQNDRQKLLNWIQQKAIKHNKIVVMGKAYGVLPWVCRSYFA